MKYPENLPTLVIACELDTTVEPHKPTQFLVFNQNAKPIGVLPIASMRAAMDDWNHFAKQRH